MTPAATSKLRRFIATPWKLATVVAPLFVFLVLYYIEPRWVCREDPLSLKKRRSLPKVLVWTVLLSGVVVAGVWYTSPRSQG